MWAWNICVIPNTLGIIVMAKYLWTQKDIGGSLPSSLPTNYMNWKKSSRFHYYYICSSQELVMKVYLFEVDFRSGYTLRKRSSWSSRRWCPQSSRFSPFFPFIYPHSPIYIIGRNLALEINLLMSPSGFAQLCGFPWISLATITAFLVSVWQLS